MSRIRCSIIALPDVRPTNRDDTGYQHIARGQADLAPTVRQQLCQQTPPTGLGRELVPDLLDEIDVGLAGPRQSASCRVEKSIVRHRAREVLDLILDSGRLDQQRLNREILIRIGGRIQAREAEGSDCRRRGQNLQKGLRAHQVLTLDPAYHLVHRMNCTKRVPFVVSYLEDASDSRFDDRLEDCRQVEMLQPAPEVASAVRAEVRDRPLETPSQVLQIVESEIA